MPICDFPGAPARPICINQDRRPKVIKVSSDPIGLFSELPLRPAYFKKVYTSAHPALSQPLSFLSRQIEVEFIIDENEVPRRVARAY